MFTHTCQTPHKHRPTSVTVSDRIKCQCCCHDDYKVRQLPSLGVELSFSGEISVLHECCSFHSRQKQQRPFQFSWRQTASLKVSVRDWLFPAKIKTHVITASRLWSPIHRDENTHLDEPGLTVNRERERKREKVMWKTCYQQHGRTSKEHPHKIHTYYTRKLSTQNMSEMHKEQTDYANNLCLHVCKEVKCWGTFWEFRSLVVFTWISYLYGK